MTSKTEQSIITLAKQENNEGLVRLLNGIRLEKVQNWFVNEEA